MAPTSAVEGWREKRRNEATGEGEDAACSRKVAIDPARTLDGEKRGKREREQEAWNGGDGRQGKERPRCRQSLAFFSSLFSVRAPHAALPFSTVCLHQAASEQVKHQREY